ncbi:MAG: hypothetical protein K2O28_00765 [Clostridia bacterium]|nr:hypothetical protein [Clostridia bacterium]
MNVSMLYGKKVISTEGRKGYVISVNAAAGKIECLTCADEDENEFHIDMKNVLKIDETILFEDRERAIKAAKPIRLGRASYDDGGIYLGNLEDMSYSGKRILRVKIGKKSYSPSELIYGDVVIAKKTKRLKSDVIKDGVVIIKKGTPVTGEVLKKAEKAGELIQTNLKSI